jgi:tetratricopeptide (TPR) repeat protein
LQIQAQLHDAQLAIQESRRESVAAAARNAEVMTTRIQQLEATLAAQRAREMEQSLKNHQSILRMAIVSGLVVLAAVLFGAYLQWRAVARLVALSPAPSSLFLDGPDHRPALGATAAVGHSNARLFSAVDSLQQRIRELELVSRAALLETPPAGAAAEGHDESLARLLEEGQRLMDAQELEMALDCFNQVLGRHPKHPEALVKKGSALEKLGRTEEAMACYDLALEANPALTLAHLNKGGLFNRLSRYEEALKCYEEALRTQEKKGPGEKSI